MPQKRWDKQDMLLQDAEYLRAGKRYASDTDMEKQTKEEWSRGIIKDTADEREYAQLAG
ncbi:hypothetical protein [Mailhella sp.]|uniref:hypothetical protein n=1 Tax=Mailhella sp. TaxID=1981029 RepID=UPI0040638625